MPNVLIAGVSTRAVAESAHRAGYGVTSLDAFADLDQHPGVHALSVPRDFGIPFSAVAAARVAADIACDAVAYLSSFENHAGAVRALAAGRTLLGNTPAVLGRVRDPRLLAAALLRRHVAAAACPEDAAQPGCHPEEPKAPAVIPKERQRLRDLACDARSRQPRGTHNRSLAALGMTGAALGMTGAALGTTTAALGMTQWILKPRASGGGHGVRFPRPGEPVPRGYYQQEYIDGTPGSVVFVAASGRAVPLGLSRQLVGERAFGARDFRYCGNILAPAGDAQFDDDHSLERAACLLASVVAEEFDLVGVNGVDFVTRAGVPYAIEVNPRYSASMELVERAYGISVFGAHATACTAGHLPSFDLAHARRTARAVGKAIVFARHDVVCGDTRPWLDDATVRDVPHPGERIPSGRPVCTVFAEGHDSAECHASLVRRADRVYDVLESWSSVAV